MTFSKLLYWLSIRYELVKGDLGDARRFYNGPKSHLWCSEIRLYEPNLNFQAKFSILKPLQQWDSWTQKTIRTIKNRTIYQTSQLPILIIRHLQNRLFNGDAFPKSGNRKSQLHWVAVDSYLDSLESDFRRNYSNSWMIWVLICHWYFTRLTQFLDFIIDVVTQIRDIYISLLESWDSLDL